MADGSEGRSRSDGLRAPRAPEPTPLWRQGYDAVEREVAPRLDAVVRSDEFAQLVGLAAHLQHAVRQDVARLTRRVLHAVNLPAATDVSRILAELGRLEKQVHELNRRLAEHEGEEVPDARPARTRRSGGPRPA